jgi:hypothetical protein
MARGGGGLGKAEAGADEPGNTQWQTTAQAKNLLCATRAHDDAHPSPEGAIRKLIAES